MSTNQEPLSPAERDRLEQELLELHFGCHADPDALRARLEADPRLQELQREALRTAMTLQQAAQPAVAALQLAPPRPRSPWWRRPWSRLLAAAAVAAVVVGGGALWSGIAEWRLQSMLRSKLHLTVSAPRAVPAGAPWSFTVQCQDLQQNEVVADLHWRALDEQGNELIAARLQANGSATVPIPSAMVVPARLEVRARYGNDEVRHTLPLSAAAAAPLVHASTDRPVYRPGESVFVRAVVLDRVTLGPRPTSIPLLARIRDAKGAEIAAVHAINCERDPRDGSIGAFVWQVPETSPGGEHRLEIAAADGSFPPEVVPFVVRSFRTPQLRKSITLDRKTYPPGARGAAEVCAERLGAGAAAGAGVAASLIVDGSEVWTGNGVLDSTGLALFRFAVPASVEHGAARFVARITDGGTVESEVEPFVVLTGRVHVACYPEGGDLVAGVENRVYVEVTDPLGRPVDTEGRLFDGRGGAVANFRTLHHGRGMLRFVPVAGERYTVRTSAGEQQFELPEVRSRGIALQALDNGFAAGAPIRLRVAGAGDGPWLIGAFARGVLVGQSTVRPDGEGRIDQQVTLELPASAIGVLRVTVFDRQLQPVAERLVQRANGNTVAVELSPQRATLAPGDRQAIAVRTCNERGEPLSAIVGITVVDDGALAMGREAPVGLVDQALLFADVERTEQLADFVGDATNRARNVDLLLGTRGWRRFVWRNDDRARQAIAASGDWASGVLAREGFSHTPQAVSNEAAVRAATLEWVAAAHGGNRLSEQLLGWSLFGLALLLLGEAGAFLARRLLRVGPFGQGMFAVAVPATLLLGMSALVLRFAAAGLMAPPEFEKAAVDHDFAGAPAELALAAAAEPGSAEQAELLFDTGMDPAHGDGAAAVAAMPPDAAEQAVPARDFVALDDFHLGVDHLGKRRARQSAIRVYAHQRSGNELRTDFTPTVFWQPLLVTDHRGEATVTFDTSDAVTTWVVRADAHANGRDGTSRIGQGEARFRSQLPFHVEAKLPVEVSAGDRLSLPVAFVSTAGELEAELRATARGPLQLDGARVHRVPLDAGRGRLLLPVAVGDASGEAVLALQSRSGRHRDVIEQRIQVAPRGFPQRRSFGGTVIAGSPAILTLAIPSDAVQGSGKLLLKLFPSPLSSLGEGLQGILQEPHGCFEQASSSNYPNTLVLSYLEASGDDLPAAAAIAARARDLLPRGYAKIAGYECKQRGYEWFGGDPGHEALTAYGLLQFHDMSKVHDVDQAMVARTREWLLARRNGSGGYQRNSQAIDSFGSAPQPITDAYVTYALLYSGTKAEELRREVDALVSRARSSGDAYELALIASALHLAARPEAAAVRARLAGLQQDDGSLRGSTTSITSSGGDDLLVETTGFALLAWLPDPAHAARVRMAAEFLQQKKTARGTFGATQATIVALRALTAFAQQSRTMQAPGVLRVFRGERLLGEAAFAGGASEAVVLDLWGQLAAGPHELRLELQGGGGALPWACDLEYCAEQPADDPDCTLELRTALRAGRVEEGKAVALDIELRNRTDRGQPMAMAIVGLPAGLELPTAVLEDLQKAGLFAFWEQRGRELVLYWRGLAPGVVQRVTLDLVARIPGTSTGPASRCYLYYTPGSQRWAVPLRIEVVPAGQ